MKKQLLVMIIMLCYATVSMTASDTIPVPRYISNIKLDVENGTLTFEDTYKPELLKKGQNREYTVYLIARNCDFKPENRFSTYKTLLGETAYSYDGINGTYDTRLVGSTKWDSMSASENEHTITMDVTNLLRKSYDVMYSNAGITFIVQPRYYESKGGGNFYLCSYYSNSYEDNLNAYLINYHECELPPCKTFNFEVPDSANYGEEMQISAKLCTSIGKRTSYNLELSYDNSTWVVVQQREIKPDEGKVNVPINYSTQYDVVGYKNAYYRIMSYIYVEYKCNNKTITDKWCDTTEVKKVDIYFPCVVAGGAPEMHKADELVILPATPDCQEYVVESERPVVLKKSGGQISFSMPAAPVSISLRQAEYTVKFLNADYTLLSTQQVKCSEDGLAPANPTMAGMTFRGWNKDFTNVHKDLSVMALYDMGEDYFFYDEMKEHKSEFGYDGFAGSEKRAIMGDSLFFDLELRTPTDAIVRYQRGLKDSNGNWTWNDPINIGTYDAAQADGESRHFPFKVAVAYEYYNKMSFRNAEAFRYNVYSAGATILSEPYEFEVYYEMGIKSMIEDPNDHSMSACLYTFNTAEDQGVGNNYSFPARYNDTVFVELQNGSAGCLNFNRTIKPSSPLTTGVSDNGKAYFICPGEEETLQVTTGKYVLLFDGAYPIKQFDFTTQGFGKYNAYYAEIVDCGGKIINMPATPEMENSIFLGWKNESYDDYADDAYLNVPAIGGNFLTFTAQWEDIPQPVYYTVRFLDKEGKLIADSEQSVLEGNNAIPPAAPEVEGFVFTGWDKPYISITEDVNIQAQYIAETAIHTITYLDIDGTTMFTEQVYDGQSANGFTIKYIGGIFIGWMNTETLQMEDLTNITSDLTLRPVFELYTYSVRFFDWNMMQIGVTQTVEYGKSAIEPKAEDIPYIEGYTFIGWDKDFSHVTEDMDIVAQYKEDPPVQTTYIVVLQTSEYGVIEVAEKDVDLNAVPENTLLHLTAVPYNEYKFVKWSDEETDNPRTVIVVSDITFSAVYEQQSDGIEDIAVQISRPLKVIVNGEMRILMPDGRQYNALGVVVK